MRAYTPVYRFGHQLLVPTMIGDSTPRLFLIDTGSQRNLLSVEAARENTKVQVDPNTHLRGLSGSVDKVYRADKAVLQFGHLRQQNQDVTTTDLTHLSDRVGTEVSGILGFDTLILLEVHIDYRDGVVDFTYSPRP
jgi:hypothetical protein